MEYIAHIREDEKEQPVAEHLENVAALAEKFGEKVGLKSTGKLIGQLHDTGKLCSDFTDYIRGGSRFKRGDIDHSYAGAKYLLDRSDKSIPTLLEARVIISHHGLHDWLDTNGGDYFGMRTGKSERYDEIVKAADELFANSGTDELLSAAKTEVMGALSKINKAIADSRVSDNALCRTQCGFYLGLLERLLESMLVDADRTDTEIFMLGRDTRLSYDREKLWDSMKAAMDEKCADFRTRTDSISVQRMSISDRCAEFSRHDVGACRLIVPTGGGKTLSSLRFAIEYCKRKGMDRIFYVAPFMSILEQNGEVIKELIGEENKELYLEHHSEMMQQLTDSDEELGEYESRAEKWDSPVIATTLVQFLNTLFSGKMSCVRRMHSLCRSVMIIDEVQAIPLKCVYMFNLAVNFLTRICGSTVVLCSATQPLFENTKYPLLLDEQDKMTGDHTQDFIAFKRTHLVDSTRTGGYSYDEAAAFCYEKYREAGNLLVVVNTKAAAAALYQLLKEANADSDKPAAVFHLSTGMCPEHRRRTIADIKEKLGNEPVICVTTQLIEAGVDISFNCVVRSLAGTDSIAQAAGRCNRNGESECRDVYIINIRDENLSRLTDIAEAGKVTRTVINSGAYSDLLSVEAMSAYFEKLYHDRESVLSYPATDCKMKTTIIDMLSVSSTRGKLSKGGCYQCFSTAGGQFSVIDSVTTAVLVPYNDDAKELIADMLSADAYADYSRLTMKAQRYSVNIYDNMKKKLEESDALILSRSACYILKEGYYSDEYGISTERTGMGFLDY